MDDMSNQSPQAPPAPANVTALAMGISGTVVGLIALLGNWLSQLGPALIPVAVIGAVLSLVGLAAACVKGFRTMELPIVGLIVSLVAVSVVLIQQQQLAAAEQRAARTQEAARQQMTADRAAAEENARQQQLAAEAQSRQDRQAASQAELAKLQAALPGDQAALENAETNFSNIQNLYSSYQQQKTYLTNAVYSHLAAQVAMWTYERGGYAQSVAGHELREANRDAAYALNGPNGATYDPAATAHSAFHTEMEVNYQANVNTVLNLDQQIAAAQVQMQNIADASDQWQAQRFNTAQIELTGAQNKVSADQSRIYYLQGALAR